MLQPLDLFDLAAALGVRRGKLLLPLVKRMLADPEPLRNLRDRIASLGDLTHGVAFKIFTEIRLTYNALLASI